MQCVKIRGPESDETAAKKIKSTTAQEILDMLRMWKR